MTNRLDAITKQVNSSLVPVGWPVAEESHIRWMATKDRQMGHDMFLIGPPGSYRRKVAMRYCELNNREVEHLVISRDTTEADLKQRKEVTNGNQTIYVDSAPVRAAIHGRVLLLDGIEKAERNVLPTLNNILENREVQLDDGRYLMSPQRYDQLKKQYSVKSLTEKGLVRVSEHFRVIALGLPVPPFPGSPLDPPLRSRFQGRFMKPSAAVILGRWPRIASLIESINISSSDNADARRLPIVTSDSMSRLSLLLSLPEDNRPDTSSAILRCYPSDLLCLDAAASSSINTLFTHFGVVPSPSPLPLVTESRSSAGFVLTPGLMKLEKDVKQDLECGFDACVIGPPGCGKSHFARSIANACGFGDKIEYLFLYGDMTARDVVQHRSTTADGSTTWSFSPVIKAATTGALLVLDGLHRVPSDLVSTLAPLIHDRQIQLHSCEAGELNDIVLMTQQRKKFRGTATVGGTEFSIHPNFRILALAEPPTGKSKWLTEEVCSLFTYHNFPEWESIDLVRIVEALNPTFQAKQFIHSVQRLTTPEDAPKNSTSSKTQRHQADDTPKLSLRQIMRSATAAASGSKGGELQRAAEAIGRQLLLDSLPTMHKKQLAKRLAVAFGTRDQSVAAVGPSKVSSIQFIQEEDSSTMIINGLECPVTIPQNPERVPHVKFVPIAKHLDIMESLCREFFINKEQFIMLLGPQGVGKNRITDYLLQSLGWERMYMQLHSDTTVQQLTATPMLENGILTWKDSPLVTAVREGLCLVLDEADKAPLEVIILLKSLVEDKYLSLADGRKVVQTSQPESQNVIPIHPNFRLIVLANKPGFPFLGNDLFRECGDVFSVFCLGNPDPESEYQLISAEAPSVDPVILRRLVSAFSELRQQNDTGKLSYPYSSRELLHVVRHMHANPESTVEEALANVLAFDRLSLVISTVIKPIFERNGIPVSRALSGQIDNEPFMTLSERALAVTREIVISETRLVPDSKLRTTSNMSAVAGVDPQRAAELVSSRVLTASGGIMSCEPPGLRPLDDVVYKRAKGFGDILLSFQIPTLVQNGRRVITHYSTVAGTGEGSNRFFFLTEQPATLITCNNPLAASNTSECSILRWGGYGGGALGTEQVAVNGTKVTAGQSQIARVSNAVVVYVPGDATQLLHIPDCDIGDTPAITQLRVSPLNFRGKRNPTAHYYMIGVDCNESIPSSSEPEYLFDPKYCILMVSLKDKNVIVVDTRKRIWREAAAKGMTVSGMMSINSSVSANNDCVLSVGDVVVTFPRIPSTVPKDQYPPVVVTYVVNPVQGLGDLTGFTSHGFTVQTGVNSNFYSHTKIPSSDSCLSVLRNAPPSDNEIAAGSGPVNDGTAFATFVTRYGEGHSLEVLRHVPASQKITEKRIELAAPEDSIICSTFTTRTVSDGTTLGLVTTGGHVMLYQIDDSSLLQSLITYLRIRGLTPYVNKILNELNRGTGTAITASILHKKLLETAKGERRKELLHQKNRTATKPKHGKEDGKKHVGGNQYAGGSGGADTAGMGGKAGPYRLDSGQDVHQISDEAKKNVSKEALAAAKKMGKEELAKRLAAINMGDNEYNLYKGLYNAIEQEVTALRHILQSIEAASKERVWQRGTEGDLDDSKIVDAKTGATDIFRRRIDKRELPGSPLLKPKRIVFLIDMSASMYRFNGVDGRLRATMESTVMLIEALHGTTRFEWCMLGHSGDESKVELVPFGKPPQNELERLKVVQKIWAHAQYCSSGDNTLNGLKAAASLLDARDRERGPADQKIIIAFSDANLDRYSITPMSLQDALLAGNHIFSTILFLASSDGEAERIAQQVPPGHAFTALDMQHVPAIIKSVFTHSLTRTSLHSSL
eukprot:TRINITY_DN1814_c0_g1_i5.p1 TRINITY_DN1814_c0_g1~~TRINITY_DN1814_c0_g1_i5.p1  ORF type:complete len:1845 (+),score=374.06 TRINITY_DN1814_c0_g1_i5:658-6192(+)